MKNKLQEIMKKGKGKKLSSHTKAGKMCALKELRDVASSMMGDDMGELKKVTVAAKDKKGLKEGLEKAKELLKRKA